MRRITVMAGLAAVSMLSAPAPALADNGWGSTNCSHTPSPVCDIAAGTRPVRPVADGDHLGNGSGNDSSGADEFDCRYVPVDYRPPDGRPEGAGGWFMVLCSPDGKDPDSHGPVWVPASANASQTLSPEQVAQIAREQLRLIAPTIAANPSGTQLVNLPTWLWLSSGWAPLSSNASVPGVSVTAVAKPTSVTWSMGDGTTVTCAGPGTPFQVGGDPRSVSPDCGHTYRTSSVRQPSQTFPVSATVHWTVTWSGAGQRGTFPDMTTTGSATFRVAESQALNNGQG